MAVLTEEQSMLRDQAKSWVAAKSPVSAFRKLRDEGTSHGFDPSVWRDICGMGWSGILIPEEFGGSGLGYLTLGLVLEEAGRTLTASPLVSSALAAASALLVAGNEVQKRTWLPKLAAGEAIGTLAVDEGHHHAPATIALEARNSGNLWVLNGRKSFVADGVGADFLVVAARTSGKPGDTRGITLFLVPASAKGLSRQSLKTADSRSAANLGFDNVSADGDAILGAVDEGFSALDSVLDRSRAGLAAEMLGATANSFEITLEYLKTRTQFGQAIGTFQALQHRAARMYTELELTRSAVEAALDGIDHNSADIAALCSLAKARANDTWHLVSNEMIQMHGGIGMTDAHDAGLYIKRARVAESLYGSSAFHRDRYATLMGY